MSAEPQSAEPLAIAFFGQFGAWTHAAARTAFGSGADYRENSTIAQVFDVVSNGLASFGVVPIENSTEGGVNQTVDELLTRKLWIKGEVVLEISQCLLGLANDLGSIQRVASHPQGLAQCRRWLAEHLPNALQVASLSTTAAAQEAASDARLAAISSPLAAELNGLRVAALYNNLAASDRRYYPLYAKCVELDVPVRIYSTMNYANDRPYDLGHPRHLDQIAMDFPELRIIAALSGWPWVNDLVGLMRRHPNLYCDTSAHHPAYFGVAGSGWEMFIQFGNTLLQDKIMVGFSKDSFALTIPQSVALYEKLPLKDKVIEKWLYGNAKEFLRC